MTQRDVVIIGGGIAGMSAGAHLADAGLSVVLIEAEPTLAYHTTGRSAAQYIENYGNDTVRRLTLASRSLLESPPEEFGDGSVLGPRPLLKVGREDRVDELAAEVVEAKELVPSTEFIDGDTARSILPVLRDDIAGAFYEPLSMDIDVATLHQIYVRWFRARGGEIRTSSAVTALRPSGDGWSVSTGSETIDAGVVVNAAGAWGDRLAELAGLSPLGLHPLRRTVAIAAIPDHYDTTHWPLTSFEPADGPMRAYAKPEPGGLLVSPADETPSEPCDAKPEELDVASGIATLGEWTTLDVRHVRSTWAGLRTFTSDRTPVSGFASDSPGFFWLVGQGGYGIHTSEALAQAARAHITGEPFPRSLTDVGLTAADIAADRPTMTGPLIPGH